MLPQSVSTKPQRALPQALRAGSTTTKTYAQYQIWSTSNGQLDTKTTQEGAKQLRGRRSGSSRSSKLESGALDEDAEDAAVDEDAEDGAAPTAGLASTDTCGTRAHES